MSSCSSKYNILADILPARFPNYNTKYYLKIPSPSVSYLAKNISISMPEKLHLKGGVTEGRAILASLFQVLSDLLKCDHTVSVCQFQSVFYVNNFASFANLLKDFY